MAPPTAVRASAIDREDGVVAIVKEDETIRVVVQEVESSNTCSSIVYVLLANHPEDSHLLASKRFNSYEFVKFLS